VCSIGTAPFSSRCLHRLVRESSCLFSADVKKLAASLSDQKQRQQNFAPILDRSVDAADLQSILRVGYPQTLGATATPKHILGALLPRAWAVSDADLRLSEPGRVVNAIGTCEDIHFVEEITTIGERFELTLDGQRRVRPIHTLILQQTPALTVQPE
jgi:hypothetical protein